MYITHFTPVGFQHNAYYGTLEFNNLSRKANCDKLYLPCELKIQPINNMIKIDQCVAVLIDGNNIERSLQSLTKKNVFANFDTLVPRLLADRALNRLVYFREGKEISSKLAERLHENFHGSVVPCHKSADIPLTIFATQVAQKVDTVIILSGDSDYVELVRYLKSRGVRVEIAAVEKNTAAVLIEEADHFSPITKEDAFELGHSKPSKPQKKK